MIPPADSEVSVGYGAKIASWGCELSEIENQSQYPDADKTLEVAYDGIVQSVTFRITPGSTYDVVKYRYNGTGAYIPYDPSTGINYLLSMNKSTIEIMMTAIGRPASDFAQFVIYLETPDEPVEEPGG